MDWKDRLALNIRMYDRLRSLIDRLFVHPPNPKEIFHLGGRDAGLVISCRVTVFL